MDAAVPVEFPGEGGARLGHWPGAESAGGLSPGSQSSVAGHSPRSQSSSEDESSDSSEGQGLRSDVESEDAMIQRQVVLLGTYLAKLEIPRPDLLRVTQARHALRCLGRVFRNDDGSDLYALSKVRQQITQFWSHSWHGRAWAKILLLLVACNGPAAVVLGTLASVTIRVLIDPEIGPCPMFGHNFLSRYTEEAVASMLVGLLVSAVTLVTWPSRKEVFLDRICIHQSDPKLKALGVLSLAAFLKHSQTMLVCWDETYIRRMWCVVEMAAFLKCHGQEPLIIRPVLLGACAVATFCVIIATIVGSEVVVELYWAASSEVPDFVEENTIYSGCFAASLMISVYLLSVAARAHFRDVAVVTEQLAHFSFMDDTVCHCCSQQHINASGQRIPCDREAMILCLDHWFGSIEQFDVLVQQRVSASFEERAGRHPLPYLWIVGSTAPMFWLAVHLLLLLNTEGYLDEHYVSSANMCGWWLFLCPVVAKLWLKLVRHCHPSRNGRLKDCMLNVALCFLVGLMFAIIRILELGLIAIVSSFGYNEATGLWVASGLAPLAGLVFLPAWRCGGCRKSRHL